MVQGLPTVHGSTLDGSNITSLYSQHLCAKPLRTETSTAMKTATNKVNIGNGLLIFISLLGTQAPASAEAAIITHSPLGSF
jgi:hypothetical protein